jgi:predicted metal-dependent peptidase
MNDEYLSILNDLQQHHALFSEFWSVGTISETTQIPTAAIQFEKDGSGLQFLVNPDFWSGLTRDEKLFVLCHECLHVYFEHGKRGLKLEHKQLFNIAGDVVINHYLCDSFGFDRSKLKFEVLGEVTRPDGRTVQGADILCWRDTTFYDDDTIEANRSMEYYYEKLVDKMEEQEQDGGDGEGGSGAPSWVKPLDDHESMQEQAQQQEQQEANGEGDSPSEELVKEIMSRMSNEELEDFQEKTDSSEEGQAAKTDQAGSFSSTMTRKIDLSKIKPKRTWENAIQDIVGRYMGAEEVKDVEQWARKSRRMAALGETDLMLPSEVEDIVPSKNKVDIWVFMDVSGSCYDYAERFLKAAASIPSKRFRVRAFSFDTRVANVDLNQIQDVRMGGGTAFDIIEQKIQSVMTEDKVKYPQSVFVITDGAGNNVEPQHPDRWHWFLIDGGYYGYGDSSRYIPPASKTYSFKDYE